MGILDHDEYNEINKALNKAGICQKIDFKRSDF